MGAIEILVLVAGGGVIAGLWITVEVAMRLIDAADRHGAL